MQHLPDLRQLQLTGCALTIGSFDGVHRGHRALIQSMLESAAGLPSVVRTSPPPPSVVRRERRPSYYITSPEEKAALLGELGVELVITQPFNRDLSRVEAEDFLDLLDRHLQFKALWAGEDFALGYQRRGNRHFLEQVSPARGVEVHLGPAFKLGGGVGGSTRVRGARRGGGGIPAGTGSLPGVRGGRHRASRWSARSPTAATDADRRDAA